MLAQVHINQRSDILGTLLQSNALSNHCKPLQLAFLPEPASRATDAQKAAQYVFLL